MSADDPVLLEATRDEFEARTKAAVLEADGIESLVTAGPPRPGIWVKRSDLDRARALLRERIEAAAEIDWDSADLGERADDLPLRRPGRKPLLFWIGWVLACALVSVGLVAAVLAVFW